MNSDNNFSSEMEALLDCIGEWILEDEQQPGLLNPVRYQQLQFTYHVMHELADGTDMKVAYEIHEPFNSMGSVSLEGEPLEFADCRWLARAISLADNLEVYPLTTGKLRMVLTFHGLVKKLNS